VISPKQRTLPDNTQHTQETDIHASGTKMHKLKKSEKLYELYVKLNSERLVDVCL